MKTPEEIKKGLEWCAVIKQCGYGCPYRLPGDHECANPLMKDALALIQQLEHERDEARQERDGLSIMLTSAESAFETMKRERYGCETCKHYNPGYFCPGCRNLDKWESRYM